VGFPQEEFSKEVDAGQSLFIDYNEMEQKRTRLASSFSHACNQPSFPKASVGNPDFDPLKAGFPLKNPAGMTG
jgi:hypothetical protein